MDYKEICLRDKIGEFLCEFAQSDDRIYVIDSDLAKSTKTLIFKEDGAKDYSPINVVINSGGGSVKAGLNIVSQMNYYQRLGVRFHTLCEEIAYSMAFLIFISGDFRSMRKYASIMFHFGYRLIPEEYILSLLS